MFIRAVHPVFSQSSRGGLSWPIPPIALPLPLQIPHPLSSLHDPLLLARARPPQLRFAQQVDRTATPAGVHRAWLHVQERLAVRVPDQVDVPAVLAPDNGQAMAAPVVVVVQGSAADHMVPATAPMRLRTARHGTPRR